MKLNMFRRHTTHHKEPTTVLANLWFSINARLFGRVFRGLCQAEYEKVQCTSSYCTWQRVHMRGCSAPPHSVPDNGYSMRRCSAPPHTVPDNGYSMRRCSAPPHTVPDNVHQPHVQTKFHVWKTRGCQCSFRLLMMGGVLPEICWASYKYRIIKILIHFNKMTNWCSFW
jgi:hypothetical protein